MEDERTRRMGVEAIPRLLLRFSLPAIAGLLANAVYNITDRIFVGQTVGPLALAAIAVGFPIQIALMAFGLMVGIGSSSRVSILLGEKRVEEAEATAGTALFLNLFGGVFFPLLGLSSLDPILRLCGAAPSILPGARTYMGIILFGTLANSVSFGLNYLIRAAGSPKVAMGTQLLGAGANVLLDALFVMGLGWGIAGAAWATVLSQLLSLLWAGGFFLRGRASLALRRRHIRFVPAIVRRIVLVGFPPGLMELSFTLILVLINRSVLRYGGELALSAVGIVFALDSLLFLPIIGLGEGLQPLVGYNYGAGLFDRVRRAVRLALRAGTTFFLCTFALVEIFPREMARLFTSDPRLLDLSVRCLRLGYLGIPFVGLGIVAGFTFQGLGRARAGLLLTFCRHVLFIIVPISLLPRVLGLDGVFLTFPISDVLGGLLGFGMLRGEMRRLGRETGSVSSDGAGQAGKN
jgi:putative MATE family efflux protein